MIREKVEPYLEYCQYRKELDEKTLKAYRIDLRQFFTFVDCEDPGREEIEDYIMELHKTRKQKTVKRKIAAIKAFYNYLEEEDVIEKNPFRKIRVRFQEAKVLPRIIPREDIEQLLNYMYSCGNLKDKYWLRDVAVVEVFFATGARVYEISNIEADCVDLNSGLICFMGKGSKERYIQIGEPSVLKLLQVYYAANQAAIRKCGYFFVNRRSERYSEQSIRDMMKKYAKQAGLERNTTPHMFRHSFATYLIDEGVDISYVQQILGHSSIKTTQIYIHVASEKQAEVLRNKHPRNRMDIKMMVSG